MVLLYKAATDQGKIVRGFIEAKDVADAATYLRKHDLFPITIAEQKENFLTELLSLGGRITSRDVVFFTQQIASMLTSGLTLMQALTVLRNQIKKKPMSEMITKIITDVEEGKTFSQALGGYPKVFSAVYISLVKAGEVSGLLDKIMLRLADTLEKEDSLRGQIKGALLYPSIVLVMMVVVVCIMMLFVVPQLNSLYESLSIELPFTTRVLVGISNFMVSFWPIIFIGVILCVVLFRRWYRSPAGKRTMDTAILKVPVLGNIVRFRILTEFSRTLGLLIGAGDPVVSSLKQAKDVTGNLLYEDAIALIARQVEKGVGVGDAFNDARIFPPLLVQMVRVGEETGKLDDNLLRASAYFEREVSATIRTLTTVMEPVIMAILGLGVAFLLIAVITPIYKLSSAI
jgi:type IV pilus assembly protein PilC